MLFHLFHHWSLNAFFHWRAHKSASLYLILSLFFLDLLKNLPSESNSGLCLAFLDTRWTSSHWAFIGHLHLLKLLDKLSIFFILYLEKMIQIEFMLLDPSIDLVEIFVHHISFILLDLFFDLLLKAFHLWFLMLVYYTFMFWGYAFLQDRLFIMNDVIQRLDKLHTAFRSAFMFLTTFEYRRIDIRIDLFNLCTNWGIFKHIDILMKHLRWSIKMSNHIDLVVFIKILCDCLGKLRLSERNDIIISQCVNTLSQNKQTWVYRCSLLNPWICLVSPFTSCKVNNGHRKISALDFEDSMRTWALMVR